MDLTLVSGFQFLIFVIPGFVTVWTFRYFTKSEKKGDFEFLGLSFFWGLIILLFYELVSPKESINKLLENHYAAAFVFSLVGPIFGWLGSRMSKAEWFRGLIKKLNKD